MVIALLLASLAAAERPPEVSTQLPPQGTIQVPISTPPGSSPTAARARANLATYVSAEDYPEDASYDNVQGMVGFRLAVTDQGRVSGCTVTASSGSQSLDDTTCRIMIERARFMPARDDKGRPIADTASGRINWRLEENPLGDEDNPPRPGWTSFQSLISAPDYPADARAQRMEGIVDFALSIATTGTVTACRILSSSGSVSLDRRTCSLMRKRVQVSPRLDDRGIAVASTINGTVRWLLPYADVTRVMLAPPIQAPN